MFDINCRFTKKHGNLRIKLVLKWLLLMEVLLLVNRYSIVQVMACHIAGSALEYLIIYHMSLLINLFLFGYAEMGIRFFCSCYLKITLLSCHFLVLLMNTHESHYGMVFPVKFNIISSFSGCFKQIER